MVKSILSAVAAAALICSYTSAAGTPDDTDSAQTLLRKSTRNLKDTEVIAAQGMEHERQHVRRENTSTNTIASENIALFAKKPGNAPPANNPGTIKLNARGGMTISGYVKLTADIVVEEFGSPGTYGGAAITLLDGAVLDCDGHSITGASSLSRTDGIFTAAEDEAHIKNCDVAAFRDGAFVQGYHISAQISIENSSFRSNTEKGINGENMIGGAGTLEMKGVTVEDNGALGIFLKNWDNVILDNVEINRNSDGIRGLSAGTLEMNGVTVYSNGQVGINLDGWDDVKFDNIVTSRNGQSGIYGKNRGAGTFEMNDVTVEDNEADGIYLEVWDDVKLKSIVASGNGDDGIQIEEAGEIILEDITAEQNSGNGVNYIGQGLPLKGTNSFSNNEKNGLNIQGVSGITVSVDAKAKVAANNNEVGIKVDSDVNFELLKKASLEACNNNVYDWNAAGGTTFTGKNYICDAAKISGVGPPDCKPCN